MSRIGADRRATGVLLRPAHSEDCHRVWTWRNDDESRRASFDSELIPLERHEAWFRDTLSRADRRLYVVLEDGRESGAVRLDISKDEAEVSIHLAPECRGRGLGTMALRALTDQAFGSLGLDRLVARVKASNSASRRAFLAAGFVVAHEDNVIRLVRSRRDMKGNTFAYLLLTGPKRWRARLANSLRGTAVWRMVRPVYRACSPVWANPVTSALSGAIRRRLYSIDPRGYWQLEGGRKYLEDEAFLLGPGSMSEKQGRFLAEEIQASGAKNVLEVGCGYGRMLKELSRNLGSRLCGADFSESQLIAGREYMAPVAIPLVLADAAQGLPFRSASFDLVYTQGCLMHVPPPQNKAFQSELARVSRQYVVHTEEFADSVHTFAHDLEGHYRALGYRLLKKIPYPLSPPGQGLTFQVFEKQKTSPDASCTS